MSSRLLVQLALVLVVQTSGVEQVPHPRKHLRSPHRATLLHERPYLADEGLRPGCQNGKGEQGMACDEVTQTAEDVANIEAQAEEAEDASEDAVEAAEEISQAVAADSEQQLAAKVADENELPEVEDASEDGLEEVSQPLADSSDERAASMDEQIEEREEGAEENLSEENIPDKNVADMESEVDEQITGFFEDLADDAMLGRLEKETDEVRTQVETQTSAFGPPPDKDTEDAVEEAEEDITEARANEERAEEIAKEAEEKMLGSAEEEDKMEDVSSEILDSVDSSENLKDDIEEAPFQPAADAFTTAIVGHPYIDFTQTIAT